MHLYQVKRKPMPWAAGLAAVFLAAVLLCYLAGARMEETAKTEGTEILRDAINRAVVSCYAIEGRYPADMEYLIENYGIQVDLERYTVFYEVFADNIRPQVRVIRLGEK